MKQPQKEPYLIISRVSEVQIQRLIWIKTDHIGTALG